MENRAVDEPSDAYEMNLKLSKQLMMSTALFETL